MKTLLATAALVTLIASPSFAQTAPRHTNARVNNQAVQSTQYGRAEAGQRHSANPANDVYDTAGRYIGSDPDPRVRMDLRNDAASD
jgi:Tfp pilus assembly protein FimT